MAKASIKPRLNIRKDSAGERYTLVVQLLYKRRRSVLFTPYKLSVREFDPVQGVAVPSSRTRAHRAYIAEVNDYLRSRIAEAERIVAELERSGTPFGVADIADRCRQRNDNRFVGTFFRTLIETLEEQGDLGTASTFRATLTAFEKFTGGRRLLFDQLTGEVVRRFEQHMLAEGLRVNTVTFYLGKLRAAYNKAARQGFASRQTNPFADTSFRIEKTRKLAVGDEVLRRVAGAEFPGRRELGIARDLFLFSFYTRGMSFVDMAYLRQSDIEDGRIRYRRRKTGQLFTVKIFPALQELIDRYRGMCSPWVLPVMLYRTSDGSVRPYRTPDAPEERQEFERILHRRYKNSRSHYLRRLIRVSRLLDLERNLTFNMARHTWASRARRQNIPVTVISEGLGHTSEKTTRIYLEELEPVRIDEANRIVSSF